MLFETVALGVCLIFLRRACLSISFAQLCGCLAARKDGTLKHGPSVGDTVCVCAKSSSFEALCIFSFVRFVLRIRKDPQRGVKYNWTPGLIPGAFGTFFSSRTRKVLGTSLAGKRPTINDRSISWPTLSGLHPFQGHVARLHPCGAKGVCAFASLGSFPGYLSGEIRRLSGMGRRPRSR